MSDAPLDVGGMDAAVSSLVGEPLVAAPDTMHGHCRLTLKADKGVTGVHIDPCHYSGILYLSQPEHCRGGTEFFRHRRTGLEAVPHDIARINAAGYADINALVEDVVNKDTRSPSKWERSFVAPMRFNRLILFSDYDAETNFTSYWIKSITDAPRNHDYTLRLPSKETDKLFGYEAYDMRFTYNKIHQKIK